MLNALRGNFFKNNSETSVRSVTTATTQADTVCTRELLNRQALAHLRMQSTHGYRSHVVGSDRDRITFPSQNEPFRSLFGTGLSPPSLKGVGAVILVSTRERLLCSHLPKRIAPRGKMNQSLI